MHDDENTPLMDLRTGFPYSLVKYGLPYSYPTLNKDTRSTIVVQGGGISGALAAYHLTRAGYDCVLLDKRSIGLGSTCASTSLIQYELDLPLVKLIEMKGAKTANEIYRLCAAAVSELALLCEEIGFNGFERKESLYYAAFKKHNPLLEEEYDARKAAGLDVSLLQDKEIKDIYGFTAGRAILSSQAGVADAYLLTHALLAAAVRHGLRVYDRTGVSETHYQRKNIEVITDKGYRVTCRYLVNAGGYEVEPFIANGLCKLHSTYALASEQFNDPLPNSDTLTWNTADPYLYMRVTSDNRLLAGGRDEPFSSPAARDKLLKHKTKLLAKDIHRLMEDTTFKPEFSWTGTFAVTRDALPFIGLHPGMRNTFFALGYGGNGITFSLIAARIITALIRDGHHPHQKYFGFGRHL